jgi:hypothetical protein
MQWTEAVERTEAVARAVGVREGRPEEQRRIRMPMVVMSGDSPRGALKRRRGTCDPGPRARV